jgi:hypothetical protein
MSLGDEANGPRKAFAKDILRIEISGLGRPQLTLVDLPGLNSLKHDFSELRIC